MPELFDKFGKILQLNRSFRRKNFESANYISQHVSENLNERINDLAKLPEHMLILGGRNFHPQQRTFRGEAVDISEIGMMRQLSKTSILKGKIVISEDEWIPFQNDSFDGAISSLHAHWIENLKEYGIRVRNVLKDNSPFIGAMIGGNSLFELKQSIEKAQILDGCQQFRARFSPTIRADDVGRFLTESGFTSITIDSDAVEVHYPDIRNILSDLRMMGGSNALTIRSGGLSSDEFKRLEDSYRKYFKNSEGIDELKSFFKHSSALRDETRPVVAVFGSQSSGKSTLLNHLFDTKFDVMTGDRRSQTTHGVWLAVEGFEHIIVLDVEGTDGRERGEDKEFERKAALFSLSIADVLIINIWENSIGLYNASNIDLLRTVLEVYFEIYSSLAASKTTILFVVRDYVGVTPIEGLEAVLKDEIDKIWNAIIKPASLETKRFEDQFNLEFAFLPHKIFKSEDFLKSVDLLRERFFAKRNSGGLLEEDSVKRILIEDFPEYSCTIWELIDSNKGLDLPTQQELLAEHRCDETISFIFSSSEEKFDSIRKSIISGELESALLNLKILHDSNIASYHEKLHRYPPHIVKSKFSSLLRIFREKILPIFDLYCDKIAKKSSKLFEHDLSTIALEELSLQSLEEAKARAIVFFRSAIQDFSNLQIELNAESKIESYKLSLEELACKWIKEIFEKKSKSLLKTFKSSSQSAFASCFNDFGPEFWENFEKKIADLVHGSLEEYDKAFKTFRDYEVFSSSRDELTLEISSVLKEVLISESSKSVLNLRFTKLMDKNFRTDSAGRPRIWENLLMIDEAYSRVLKKTDNFIEIYSSYHPSKEMMTLLKDFDIELILLNEESKEDLKDVVRRESESLFLEAKRALVSANGSIPTWVIILLVILGWNEFVAIVSSPLYLALSLIAITVGFVLYNLKLTGPITNVIHSFTAILEPKEHNDPDVKAKNE